MPDAGRPSTESSTCVETLTTSTILQSQRGDLRQLLGHLGALASLVVVGQPPAQLGEHLLGDRPAARMRKTWSNRSS